MLAKHYKKAHEISKYICAECNFKTNINVEIESHILEHERQMQTIEAANNPDVGDETVNAVDSLACYAADQVYSNS